MPRGRGRCSTSRTSAPSSAPARTRYATLQWLLTNDLGRIEPGPGAVHAPARPRRRARRRRHHRLVGRTRALLRHAERVEHRPAARALARQPVDAPSRRHRADITASRAVLAVQGPHAARSCARCRRTRPRCRGSTCRRWGSGSSPAPATPARTVSRSTSPPTRRPGCGTRWSTPGITPAGLGARDTLRLEAGLPLHGHELGPGITPLQARLGWVVRWDKGDFRGPCTARSRSATRARAGCSTGSRSTAANPAARARSCRTTAREVGVVTSGNFSPTLGHAIAFAFLRPTRARRRGRGRRARQAVARSTSRRHAGSRARAGRPAEILAMVQELATTSASPTRSCSIRRVRSTSSAERSPRSSPRRRRDVAGFAIWFRTFSTWLGARHLARGSLRAARAPAWSAAVLLAAAAPARPASNGRCSTGTLARVLPVSRRSAGHWRWPPMRRAVQTPPISQMLVEERPSGSSSAAAARSGPSARTRREVSARRVDLAPVRRPPWRGTRFAVAKSASYGRGASSCTEIVTCASVGGESHTSSPERAVLDRPLRRVASWNSVRIAAKHAGPPRPGRVLHLVEAVVAHAREDAMRVVDPFALASGSGSGGALVSASALCSNRSRNGYQKNS